MLIEIIWKFKIILSKTYGQSANGVAMPRGGPSSYNIKSTLKNKQKEKLPSPHT